MFDISITSLPTPQQHCWLHQKTLDHPHSSQILLHFGSLRRCCHIPVIKSRGLHRFQRVSQCSTFHHPTKKLVNYWKPILLASLAKRSGMLPLERKSSSCSKDVESSNSPEAHGERSMLWIADWDGWVEDDVDTSHFPAVFLAAQWRWWRPGSVHLWSDYQSGGKPVLTLGEAKICKWKSESRWISLEILSSKPNLKNIIKKSAKWYEKCIASKVGQSETRFRLGLRRLHGRFLVELLEVEFQFVEAIGVIHQDGLHLLEAEKKWHAKKKHGEQK